MFVNPLDLPTTISRASRRITRTMAFGAEVVARSRLASCDPPRTATWMAENVAALHGVEVAVSRPIPPSAMLIAAVDNAVEVLWVTATGASDVTFVSARHPGSELWRVTRVIRQRSAGATVIPVVVESSVAPRPSTFGAYVALVTEPRTRVVVHLAPDVAAGEPAHMAAQCLSSIRRLHHR